MSVNATEPYEGSDSFPSRGPSDFQTQRRNRSAIVALRIAQWLAKHGTAEEKSGVLSATSKTPLGTVYAGILAEDGPYGIIRAVTGTEPYSMDFDGSIPAGYLPGAWDFIVVGSQIKWTRQP